MQSMSRQAVVKVEAQVNMGIDALPAPRADVQAFVDGVPFVVRNVNGQLCAFPGKVKK